jgi:hypothetical protein
MLVNALNYNNIDLVLDCGANRGQFANILIKNFIWLVFLYFYDFESLKILLGYIVIV